MAYALPSNKRATPLDVKAGGLDGDVEEVWGLLSILVESTATTELTGFIHCQRRETLVGIVIVRGDEDIGGGG